MQNAMDEVDLSGNYEKKHELAYIYMELYRPRIKSVD